MDIRPSQAFVAKVRAPGALSESSRSFPASLFERHLISLGNPVRPRREAFPLNPTEADRVRHCAGLLLSVCDLLDLPLIRVDMDIHQWAKVRYGRPSLALILQHVGNAAEVVSCVPGVGAPGQPVRSLRNRSHPRARKARIERSQSLRARPQVG